MVFKLMRYTVWGGTSCNLTSLMQLPGKTKGVPDCVPDSRHTRWVHLLDAWEGTSGGWGREEIAHVGRLLRNFSEGVYQNILSKITHGSGEKWQEITQRNWTWPLPPKGQSIAVKISPLWSSQPSSFHPVKWMWFQQSLKVMYPLCKLWFFARSFVCLLYPFFPPSFFLFPKIILIFFVKNNLVRILLIWKFIIITL